MLISFCSRQHRRPFYHGSCRQLAAGHCFGISVCFDYMGHVLPAFRRVAADDPGAIFMTDHGRPGTVRDLSDRGGLIGNIE